MAERQAISPESAEQPLIAHGLAGVVAAATRLSKVDGQAGRLTIAGFALEELALTASFEELLYLLWEDRLPTEQQLSELLSELAQLRRLPKATLDILQVAARRKLPPMEALRIGVDTLSLVDENPEDQSEPANRQRAKLLVANMPTIVAAYWRLSSGRRPVEPRQDLGHAANYLYMLSGETPHPAVAKGLGTYLNTVIDHGMNNSTFTARVIISTGTDMISAVVGAIGALKGPLHGGAPGPALDMVFAIRRQAARSGRSLEAEAEEYIRDLVSAGGRIMGFGHRVYKVRDPRADVLGRAASELFRRAGDRDLYQAALTVEQVALRVLEELKPGRMLKTNVEFYTALILHGVGLELPLFTPTFAISRVGGWTGHILEQISEGRLIRPRAAYSGEQERKWTPLERRS